MRAYAGQQNCVCEPQQQLQAEAGHKVLGIAKLVGPNGAVLRSSQGNVVVRIAPATSSQHKPSARARFHRKSQPKASSHARNGSKRSARPALGTEPKPVVSWATTRWASVTRLSTVRSACALQMRNISLLLSALPTRTHILGWYPCFHKGASFATCRNTAAAFPFQIIKQ